MNTALGNVQGTAENSVHVSNSLYIQAYNNGIDLYYEMADYIYAMNMEVAETYKNFTLKQFNYINTLGI
jgi:hypothetical protein